MKNFNAEKHYSDFSIPPFSATDSFDDPNN